MSRCTAHSSTFISISEREPTSDMSPATRGAANGNSSVGVWASLRWIDCGPRLSTCSVPTHFTSASMSEYDAMFAGTTHSFAS